MTLYKYRIVETHGGKFYVEWRRVSWSLPSWRRGAAEFTQLDLALRHVEKLKAGDISSVTKKVHKC